MKCPLMKDFSRCIAWEEEEDRIHNEVSKIVHVDAQARYLKFILNEPLKKQQDDSGRNVNITLEILKEISPVDYEPTFPKPTSFVQKALCELKKLKEEAIECTYK